MLGKELSAKSSLCVYGWLLIKDISYVGRMETLKRNLPVSGQEGLQELRKMAIRFEEKTFTAATSQGDYLRKMSLKLLPMETKSQNPPANSLPSNSAGNGNRPPDLDPPNLKAPCRMSGKSLTSSAAHVLKGTAQIISQVKNMILSVDL
ncbi:hypothetical protein I3760_02G159600 [Carya illinoinensis]|nr:hypothetical protein I3760_02G159600 [Carya illinoinensis]